MTTKTIILKSDGNKIERIGTSGVTITLDANRHPPFINIEYDMVSRPEMITMIKDLLSLAYEQMPGVAENAIARFAEDNKLVDFEKGQAHIKWKKGDK